MKILQEGVIEIKADGTMEVRDFVIDGGGAEDLVQLAIDRTAAALARVRGRAEAARESSFPPIEYRREQT